MPGGDGTGPLGRGPGRGICIGAGFRRGLGMGTGRGFGMGRGLGMGAGIYPVDARSQKTVLENRAALLEQELAVLKAQLGEDPEAK